MEWRCAGGAGGGDGGYLCAVPVEEQCPHVVRVALELHLLLTRTSVPHTQHLQQRTHTLYNYYAILP